jgi:hypothetical protein
MPTLLSSVDISTIFKFQPFSHLTEFLILIYEENNRAGNTFQGKTAKNIPTALFLRRGFFQRGVLRVELFGFFDDLLLVFFILVMGGIHAFHARGQDYQQGRRQHQNKNGGKTALVFGIRLHFAPPSTQAVIRVNLFSCS